MKKKIKNNKNLVLKLRDIRREKGLSLQEVANKSGLDYQKIGRVERGETHATIDTLSKLAKVLNIPLSKVIEEENLPLRTAQKGSSAIDANVDIIPSIYSELDFLCKKHSIDINNQVKVYLATAIFKLIQDLCTNAKDEKDVVTILFRGYDAILERLSLTQKD